MLHLINLLLLGPIALALYLTSMRNLYECAMALGRTLFAFLFAMTLFGPAAGAIAGMTNLPTPYVNAICFATIWTIVIVAFEPVAQKLLKEDGRGMKFIKERPGRIGSGLIAGIVGTCTLCGWVVMLPPVEGAYFEQQSQPLLGLQKRTVTLHKVLTISTKDVLLPARMEAAGHWAEERIKLYLQKDMLQEAEELLQRFREHYKQSNESAELRERREQIAARLDKEIARYAEVEGVPRLKTKAPPKPPKRTKSPGERAAEPDTNGATPTPPPERAANDTGKPRPGEPGKEPSDGAAADAGPKRTEEDGTAEAKPETKAAPYTTWPFSGAEAQRRQAETARRLQVARTRTLPLPNSQEMEFRLIPPGEFLMGAEMNPDQRPVHRVRITKAFYLSTTEVTVAQWMAVLGRAPGGRRRSPDAPVTNVSWHMAQSFCERLAEMRGVNARLPTEAEWEYACRAGSTMSLMRERTLHQSAWFRENSGGYVRPVARKKANPWGLHDMLGNVAEWCRDFYGKDYYERSPAEDPAGPDHGQERVVRGGAASFSFKEASPALRRKGEPQNRSTVVGFRVAIALDG